MTSLYPGMLFFSTGLNRKSTPFRPETTPSEIDRKLGRAPFNGRPWPKSSPVSAVYDVRNSSTRMIILNNKLSKKPKGSRLRGQSDYEGDIVQPAPERHLSDSSHTNWVHHKQCSVSVSEKFVPIFPPGVTPVPEWVNKTQRPPMKFDNGSGVNPNHHIQCQGHMDYDIIRWYNTHRRPRSRTSTTKDSRVMSPILNDQRMSQGERRYLSSIAKIYSVEDMKQQKQLQYNQLMWKEISKGGYKPHDWERYNRYLNTPRKTQFGPCDQFHQRRSISAPGNRKDSRHGEEGDEARPHTTQTEPRPTKNSRGSIGNRSRERRGGNRPLPQGQLSRQTKGKQSHNGKKGPVDLTGKPARVESPMILRPKASPASSLSSLNETQEEERSRHEEDLKMKEREKERETSLKESEKNVAGDLGQSQTEQEERDDSKQHAIDTKITVDEVADDKRMSDEDDERSKMSARDTARSDEQRGQALEYRPTYGERSAEDERSQEGNVKEVSKETYQYTDQARADQEQGGNQRQHDEVQEKKDSAKATWDISEESEQEDVVRLQKITESQENTKVEQDPEEQADFRTDGPELIHHIHKEGKDRPLSRLGGREQFMVIKKEPQRENSDDDYSDDEEESERSRQRADDATDQVRGDHNQANLADGRAVEQMPVIVKSTLTADRTTDSEYDGKESELKFSNQKEDGVSEVSSRAVEGSSDPSKASAVEPVTPTEASTQEKPSDISTIDY